MTQDTANGLLDRPLRVINVGLERFAEDLAGQGVSVVQMDWSPPAGGNAELAGLLSSLDAKAAGRIEQANAEALQRMLAADPFWLMSFRHRRPSRRCAKR